MTILKTVGQNKITMFRYKLISLIEFSVDITSHNIGYNDSVHHVIASKLQPAALPPSAANFSEGCRKYVKFSKSSQRL